MGVRWYRTVVLICISLVTNGGEQFFPRLQAHLYICFVNEIGLLNVGSFHSLFIQIFLCPLFCLCFLWDPHSKYVGTLIWSSLLFAERNQVA